MVPLGVIAIIFISMAVVMNVLGQFTTIWDFLGLKHPHFAFPMVAFLGTIPFMLLLSAIVTINVAPAGSNLSLANELALLAIQGAVVPNALAVITLGLALGNPGSRFNTAKSELTPLPARLTGLFICDAILVVYLFNLVPLPPVMPSSATLIFGLAFTIIPLIYSLSRDSKETH